MWTVVVVDPLPRPDGARRHEEHRAALLGERRVESSLMFDANYGCYVVLLGRPKMVAFFRAIVHTQF